MPRCMSDEETVGHTCACLARGKPRTPQTKPIVHQNASQIHIFALDFGDPLHAQQSICTARSSRPLAQAFAQLWVKTSRLWADEDASTENGNDELCFWCIFGGIRSIENAQKQGVEGGGNFLSKGETMHWVVCAVLCTVYCMCTVWTLLFRQQVCTFAAGTTYIV